MEKDHRQPLFKGKIWTLNENDDDDDDRINKCSIKQFWKVLNGLHSNIHCQDATENTSQ